VHFQHVVQVGIIPEAGRGHGLERAQNITPDQRRQGRIEHPRADRGTALIV